MIDLWYRFSNARTEARAIEWLAENDLCDEAEAALAVKERTHTADQALDDTARWSRGTP